MGTTQSTQHALRQIDQREGGINRYVDKLFYTYDRDGSGMLEGREAQQLVDEVTQYMMNDLRHQGYNYDYATVRQWVYQTLDTNHDGRLSRYELHRNLKHVLDAGEGAALPSFGYQPSYGPPGGSPNPAYGNSGYGAPTPPYGGSAPGYGQGPGYGQVPGYGQGQGHSQNSGYGQGQGYGTNSGYGQGTGYGALSSNYGYPSGPAPYR